MSKPKGSKNKATGSRFKLYEGRYPIDKHIRLTKDMMVDAATMKLSANAYRLYTYMKLWATGKDGVTYAASMAKGIMSKSSFFRARDELVEAGFIKYSNAYTAKDKRETGSYVFSDDWAVRLRGQTNDLKRGA